MDVDRDAEGPTFSMDAHCCAVVVMFFILKCVFFLFALSYTNISVGLLKTIKLFQGISRVLSPPGCGMPAACLRTAGRSRP